jgi:hypothetical protein
MNVLIISRCTKNAHDESCRIIDQFAERTGDAAWQTIITLEGVSTLRKLCVKPRDVILQLPATGSKKRPNRAVMDCRQSSPL